MVTVAYYSSCNLLYAHSHFLFASHLKFADQLPVDTSLAAKFPRESV